MRAQTALDNMFRAAGFTIGRRARHQIWKCPCGHAMVTTACSIGYGSAFDNAKSQLARTLRVCKQNMANAA